MRLFFITIILRFVSWLPLSVNRFFGSGVGTLVYLLSKRERHTTLRNLELCFPEMSLAERKSVARQSMKESAKWAFETPSIWFRGVKWREAHIVSFQNKALYQQAIADERGVLVLVPHFGNWEMAGLWLGGQAKGTGIYRTPKMAYLDPLVRKARESTGQSTLVPATTRGVMAVFKALQRGEQTALLPDQVPAEGSGIYANFYGIPAYTGTLPHSLIKKANPIVLMLYVARVSGGFELNFAAPDEAIYAENAQTSVEAMNRSIATLCQRDISQYQWEYKRFKNQQDGRDFYAR